MNLVDPLGLTPDPYGFDEAETLGTMGSQRGIDIANQAPKIVQDTVREGVTDVAIAAIPFHLAAGAIARVGEGVVSMTQWGWAGSRSWLRMARILERGGTLEDLGGKVPTLEEATDLLQKARCKVERTELLGHAPPNPHTYPHINYTTPSGTKGTVRVR